MRYNCNKCKKDLGNSKEGLFIAESGEYLCKECSKGATPVDKELMTRVEEYIKER